MDKYEYKVRAEEINSLIEQKKYAEAVKIADTIDWRRVKSAKMLCKVSELYKMNRRYEDSKEILLLADEHLPDSRNIIYSLCELSIKLEDIVPAVEYYKQFIQIAPRDTKRYILQYRLYEAQDVSLEERIAVLEEYKKRDYCEKWGYELAYLYHRVGLATRCVEECDELILWFGEGKYVIKAMELKMLHAPLTTSQQEKYDRRFETESTAYVVKKPDESREAAMEKANLAAKMLLESANKPIMSSVSMETIPSMPIQIKSVEVSNAPTTRIPSKNVEEELANGGDTVRIDVPEIPLSEPPADVDFEVKTMDVGKYNTINLQKELAQNLAAVMQQEDMEASDATKTIPVDSINDLVPEETIPAESAEPEITEEVSTEEFFSMEEPTDPSYEQMPEYTADEPAENSDEQLPEEAGYEPAVYETTEESADEDSVQMTEEAESVQEQPYEEAGPAEEPSDITTDEVEEGQPSGEVSATYEPEEAVEESAEPADEPEQAAEEMSEESAEDLEATKEYKPLVDTAVTKAVIEEVRRAIGDEPRETITEEDLLNSLNEPEESGETVETAFIEPLPGIFSPTTEPVYESESPEEITEETNIEETDSEENTEENIEESAEIPEERSIIIESIPQSELDAEEEIAEQVSEEESVNDFHAVPKFEYIEPVIISHEPEEMSEADEEKEVPVSEQGTVHEPNSEPEPEPVKPEVPVAVPPVAVEPPVVLQPSPVVVPGVSGVAQVQMENPDAPLVEKQITGQLTFNDIVAGWEGTKKAAEERRLEEMRRKVMAETGPLLQEPEPAADAVYPTDLDTMAPVLNVFDKVAEPVITPEDEVEELTEIKPVAMDTAEINGLEEKLLSSYETAAKQQITTPLEPIDISGVSTGNTDQIEMAKQDFDSELERQVLAALEDNEPEPEKKTGFHTEDFKIDVPEPEKTGFHTEDFKIDEPEPEKREIKPAAEIVKEPVAPAEPIEPTPPRHEGTRVLTKEEKDLFGAISQTKKVQEEIAYAIDNISLYPGEGNVLITGEKGVGTVDFAKNLIKVLASIEKRFSGRVAKVTGEQLNTRNIKETLNGLGNGALIVEKAGELTDFALIALSDYLREPHPQGVVLFFEDTKTGIGSLCAKENMPLASFNIKVDISTLDNDGLVNYGKDYAMEQDYSIDEMGVLALYTRISERQTIEHAVTVEEVKQLIDQAIARSNKASVGHFMDVIAKKRYDNDDRIILKEKDFL